MAAPQATTLMRARIVVLAIVAGLVAAAAVLYLRQHATAPAGNAIVSVPPAAITRLEARMGGRPALVLVRSAHGWRLRHPVRAPAAASRVALLLAALYEAPARSYPASAMSAGAIGLAAPALTVKVNGETVEYGGLNPVNLLRYLRHGDRIFLTMDRVLPLLAAGPWQFVDLHPIPRDGDIATVRFSRGGTREGRKFRNAWKNVTATRVTPLATASVAATAEIRIRLVGRRQPLVFRVLARTPELELARPTLGLVYLFPSRIADRLLPSAPAGTHARTARSRDDPPRT
ncbi:MAG TPA: hypothetical protein VFX38_02255 [Gammaproteobacteria bacterium]|nr:hypothetical protein [Gammaproteobacteria bacterium]